MNALPTFAEPLSAQATGTSGRLKAMRQKLEAGASQLNGRPGLLIGLMTVFYVITALLTIRKGLWFDELFTYYIARQESIGKLLEANYNTDLNPPLPYLLVRWSHQLFGNSEIATRLPSVVGFWVGSAAFFSRLGKRTGYLVAGGAVAALWSGFFQIYAVEARPYGLWLGFFGCALYCWDIYPEAKRPHLAAAGLFTSVLAMMLTHVLAPFAIAILCAGELARSWQRRRIGWLWVVLLLPISLELAYLYWMRQFEKILFPAIYQASLSRMVRFYARLTVNLATPLCAAATAGALFTRWRSRLQWTYRFRLTDAAVGVAMFLMPFAIVAALARSQGAFHFRYAVIGSLVLWTVCSIALNSLFRNQPLPAAAFLFTLLAAGFVNTAVGRVGFPATPELHPALSRISAGAPLVAGSGLTFLEVDHYEPHELTSRLYYLTDREYAASYAHDTLFEGIAGLKKYFPIRGSIEPYRDFLRQHKHFFVLGDKNYLEDWLLKRLADEPGMSIKLAGNIPAGYKDRDVYEITGQPTH